MVANLKNVIYWLLARQRELGLRVRPARTMFTTFELARAHLFMNGVLK